MGRQRKNENRQSPEEQRTASAKRDAAFLENRRATEAANLKRTLALRALRLAHKAQMDKNPK